MMFYVLSPVQIKPHVGGLKSNKTYLLQCGSLKLNTNTEEKTTLLQKKINMPTKATPV